MTDVKTENITETENISEQSAQTDIETTSTTEEKQLEAQAEPAPKKKPRAVKAKPTFEEEYFQPNQNEGLDEYVQQQIKQAIDEAIREQIPKTFRATLEQHETDKKKQEELDKLGAIYEDKDVTELFKNLLFNKSLDEVTDCVEKLSKGIKKTVAKRENVVREIYSPVRTTNLKAIPKMVELQKKEELIEIQNRGASSLFSKTPRN